jgi:NurA-like 5'-3' nuclease
MNKIENYIDNNLTWLLELTDSEVEQIPASNFDDDVIDYLKQIERFDYKSICVYYVVDENEVWVENMS